MKNPVPRPLVPPRRHFNYYQQLDFAQAREEQGKVDFFKVCTDIENAVTNALKSHDCIPNAGSIYMRADRIRVVVDVKYREQNICLAFTCDLKKYPVRSSASRTLRFISRLKAMSRQKLLD